MKIPIAVIIFFAVIILQIFYVVDLYYNDQICLHDSISHLNHARRVVDNNYAGLGQLGHVWLPFVFLLYLPLVWNDFMWHSCLAGSIVSIISIAIASVFIYKLASEFYETKYAGIVAFAIFFMNPSVRYIGAIPMLEGPLLMPLAVSAYYFFLWIKTEMPRYIIFASISASVATLIRYEAWFIPLFYLILVPLILISRKRKYEFIEGNVFLVIPWAFLGIILWMAFLTAIFKDPLYFSGVEGVGGAAIRIGEHIASSTTDLIETTNGIFFAYSNVFGCFTLLSALIGAILICYLYRNWSISVFIILIVPFFFSFWRVHPVYMAESRHIIQNVLFIALLASTWVKVLSISKHKYLPVVLTIIIIFLNILFIPEPSVKHQLVELSEYHEIGINVGGYLKEHYTGGMILCSPADAGEIIIFYSYLSPKEFIEPHDRKLWEDALKEPWTKAEYVVMITGKEEQLRTYSLPPRWLEDENFKMHYIQAYSFQDYIIFKRK